MSTWKTYQLKELCSEIIDCVNKTAPLSDTPTEYKMLRTSDIRNGFINLDYLNCVSEETFEKWSRRGRLQEGDVILTREAPLGEVGLVRHAENYFLGQRLVLYRANPDVCDGRFMMYALIYDENKQAIIGKGNGSTVLHLRVPDCETIEIKSPDLPTQKRIADILSAYDDLIENNQRQIKLLEEAAMRLYREWFVFMRFPGHESVRIVDGVPEGWEYQKLKEIADIVMGQSPDSSYYNSDGDGLPFHQGVSNYGERYVSNVEYCSVEKRCAVPNSILFSVRAPVGRINLTREKVVIGRGLAALNHKLGKQSYLFYLLRSHFSVEDMIGNGSVFSAVTKSDLEDQKLLIPSFDLIEMFSRIVEPMDSKINSLDMQIERLQKVRDALLPRLMNGGMGLKLAEGAV